MRLRLPVAWRLVGVLCALLTLPACLVYVSSAPGSVKGANIVFIAVTDGGGLVARLKVSVVSTDGDWRQEGMTSSDGVFRVSVAPGVRRVRASVTLPAGYAAAEPDHWPRDIDMEGGDVEVRVRVNRA